MLSVRYVRNSCLGASGNVGVLEFSLWMSRPLSPSTIPELLLSLLSSNCRFALESSCEDEVMELCELI